MQTSRRTTLTRIRSGGVAAVLAGVCYGTAGYLDKPGMSVYASTLVSGLSVVIPALFLGGLLGLHSRLLLASRRNVTSEIGLLLGCLGAVLGIIDAVGSEIRGWWWVLLLAGLTSMGLAAFLKEGSRLLGTVALTSGAFGWISLLTDPAFSGVLVPLRPVHVAFAAVFCLSSVAWGSMLLVEPNSYNS